VVSFCWAPLFLSLLIFICRQERWHAQRPTPRRQECQQRHVGVVQRRVLGRHESAGGGAAVQTHGSAWPHHPRRAVYRGDSQDHALELVSFRMHSRIAVVVVVVVVVAVFSLIVCRLSLSPSISNPLLYLVLFPILCKYLQQESYYHAHVQSYKQGTVVVGFVVLIFLCCFCFDLLCGTMLTHLLSILFAFLPFCILVICLVLFFLCISLIGRVHSRAGVYLDQWRCDRRLRKPFWPCDTQGWHRENPVPVQQHVHFPRTWAGGLSGRY
jgi:hypothetical protein